MITCRASGLRHDQRRAARCSRCRRARKRTLAAGPRSACSRRTTPTPFHALRKNGAEHPAPWAAWPSRTRPPSRCRQPRGPPRQRRPRSSRRRRPTAPGPGPACPTRHGRPKRRRAPRATGRTTDPPGGVQVDTQRAGRHVLQDPRGRRHPQRHRAVAPVTAPGQHGVEPVRAGRRADLEPRGGAAGGVELFRPGDPALQRTRPGPGVRQHRAHPPGAAGGMAQLPSARILHLLRRECPGRPFLQARTTFRLPGADSAGPSSPG